jgi:hypothetical protein
LGTGAEEFRRELLAAVEGQVGAHLCGAERQETGAQKAERIVREELKRLGWPEDELQGRPKGHSGKVMMARRVGPETTLSLKWIAQRLQIGTWTYVSNLLKEKQESQRLRRSCRCVNSEHPTCIVCKAFMSPAPTGVGRSDSANAEKLKWERGRGAAESGIQKSR